ncbi:MAG TPA: phenylalanine--tRNA ligase subunit alpha [Thermoplasmata archaeon]|nr:phenylalanine--tRNA ligase subunit alpha [Thermoplasmata archaeon]
MPDADEPDGPVRSAELSLSDPERRLLAALQGATGPREEDELSTATALAPDTTRSSLQRLRSKHLALVEEEHQESVQLTARGRSAREHGLPERRMLDALVRAGGTMPAEQLGGAAGLDDEERAVAIGVLRRAGYLDQGSPFRLRADAPDPSSPLAEEEFLRSAGTAVGPEAKLLAALKRRGLVEVARRTTRRWRVAPEGARLVLPAEGTTLLGALSPEDLRSGRWRSAGFRPYDVRAEVPYRSGPAPHPYARFLDEFAEILVGLGFEESEGPLVETEFWNGDVLNMPQDHPARSVHDVFFLTGIDGHAPPAGLVDRVAAAQEGRPMPGESEPISRGWRVPYRPDVARRPVMRSQTTAVSARFLAAHPTPPFRMFCLDRNFRPDALDATHHVEFAQAEGVLGGEGTSLRDLVGVFRELAEAIGIRELKVRPSYFPFTEPSVEAYVRHPRLGWMEIFPGGMLRPEVLRPLGIEVPVAAWGIGVTRLAMVALQVADIRDLFSDDLGRLTGREG